MDYDTSYDIAEFITKPENITTFRNEIMEMLTVDPNLSGLETLNENFNITKQIEKENEHQKWLWKTGKKKLTKMSPNAIVKIAETLDGHTIFLNKHFEDLKLPDELINAMSRRQWSNYQSPKSTFYNNSGQQVDFIEGIYGAHVLEVICETFKIKYEDKMGRGSQAYEQIAQIKKQLLVSANIKLEKRK